MRNTWLIIKREYLERVRTRSFVILTVLFPAIMSGLMVIPAKLANVGGKNQHIVVVTSTRELGEAVKQEMLSAHQGQGSTQRHDADAEPDSYIVDVDPIATEAERAALRERVSRHEIDGYLWLTHEAIARRMVTWNSREVAALGGFAGQPALGETLARAIAKQQLASKGIQNGEADTLLKPMTVVPLRIEHGREVLGSGGAKFFEITVMIMLIYMAVLLYGISVMRSVLEEKNSRIIEVLLSSASSTELMAGKLIGVGAVGLTQIAAWAVMAGTALPSLTLNASLADLRLPPSVFVAFGAFFLAGYFLYSTMYAAIGAICTTEQEGQQLQFLVVLPLVISVFMLMPTLRSPDAAIVFWMSMIPLFAPVVMFARIVVQTPPLWQIALSVFLLVATSATLLVFAARIYRVGILMYGKRLTLPEVVHWMRRARA